MARLHLVASLLACLALATSARPLAADRSGRQLLQGSSSAAPPPPPLRNESIWTIPPLGPFNETKFVTLLELKAQTAAFKLMDATTSTAGLSSEPTVGSLPSGGASASGGIASAAISNANNAYSAPKFVDPNSKPAEGGSQPAATQGATAAAAVKQAASTSDSGSGSSGNTNAQPTPSPSPSTPAPTPSPSPEPQPSPSPEPAPSPSPEPSPSPAPSTGGGSCPDPQSVLDVHNSLRAAHGAAPLSWSEDVAASAQAWANTCAFDHSYGALGENLMMGYGLDSCSKGAQGWATEAAYWTPGSNSWIPDAGHFTQMVWKGTTQLGCGMANCGSRGAFVVCQYNSHGNVDGQFASNVG